MKYTKSLSLVVFFNTNIIPMCGIFLSEYFLFKEYKRNHKLCENVFPVTSLRCLMILRTEILTN